MIKYLNTTDGSYLIKFNKETEEVKSLENISTNIDWMWIADEDGELDGKEIKAGDIIFRMYGIGRDRYNAKREYIILKDEALIEYYKRLKAYYDEERKSREECCDCEDTTCGHCIKHC